MIGMEFIDQWYRFGISVALKNALITFTKWAVGAKRITLTYKKYGRK